ncbi:MAG: dihydroorotase [Actinomycetota bacterium]|nr:dihydroorotase [Actinomycetota bacterium]
MSETLIKGGHVIDSANGIDEELDLLVKEGKISDLKKGISQGQARVIDAKGLVVLPGLIDMHVHLREPGREDEETIETGSKAAAFSGFTSIACMPNTAPVNDSPTVTQAILSKAREACFSNVLPVAAITKSLEGVELSDMALLLEAGAVAFSDDGRSVKEASVMRRALQYAKMLNALLIVHPEDSSLSLGGQINEGIVSTRLGLKGIPSLSEEVMVARDIILAREAAANIHFTHISTRGSVELIRRAKADGAKVTCDVTPHHLILSDEDMKGYDPNFKVNPPLRSGADLEALKEGLTDGTIDAIASDHAPHADYEKEVEFENAPFGLVGLETTLPLMVTKIVGEGILTMAELIEKMASAPARILSIDKGSLSISADADVVIFDPRAKVKVEPHKFISKSRNTPFAGWSLNGKIIKVIIGGREIV